jgi:5-methylthioadenosine/S-adenosylhomocysteine deaminase
VKPRAPMSSRKPRKPSSRKPFGRKPFGRKSRETWILGATLVTQNSKREALQKNLRLLDGQIAEITAKTPQSRSSAQVVRATGLTIFPGFVQAHVHLCQTLFRNQADDLELLDWLSKKIWIYEAAHTFETLKTSALLGIHELLTSGTTCILDMGTVRHTRAILEAVEETGIRASVGKCLMDHPENTPEYLREPTKDALREALELYEQWHGTQNDRIRVSLAPRFALSCTQTLLESVAQAAREKNILVHTHSSENRKEIAWVKSLTGKENIDYLHSVGLTGKNLVLAHCVWLSEEEKRILKNTGTHVAHCPSSNLKLASGIAEIPDLLRRGINVALGADGAPCNNQLHMQGEMRLAALLQKPQHGPTAMKAHETLDLATLGGARALGWEDQIGSLEEGKRADFFTINLQTPEIALPSALAKDYEALASALVYSSSPLAIRSTWVEGTCVASNGRMKAASPSDLTRLALKAHREIDRAILRGIPRNQKAGTKKIRVFEKGRNLEA